jgi:hypothetical protein
MDLLGVLPWLVVGRLLKKRRFGQEAGLYDRVGVPITRLLESHIKRRKMTVPVGKSLVLVARKAR